MDSKTSPATIKQSSELLTLAKPFTCKGDLSKIKKELYTVFHKFGTPLYFFNNILPCGPISIMDIPNCSAENWLAICDTFTYLTFRYFLTIVTSHPYQYLRVADNILINKKLITMPFSVDDKHAIKLLRQTKQYGAKHLMSMFPDKQ